MTGNQTAETTAFPELQGKLIKALKTTQGQEPNKLAQDWTTDKLFWRRTPLAFRRALRDAWQVVCGAYPELAQKPPNREFLRLFFKQLIVEMKREVADLEIQLAKQIDDLCGQPEP